MQNLVVEDRITTWAEFRHSLDTSEDPLKDIADFWSEIKLVPFNKAVDPYNHFSWPSPWQIIADNSYDDLTVALMIGYTIKLTNRFKNSRVEIRSLVDSNRKQLYNLVYIDDEYVLNYHKAQVIEAQNIPESFFLENLVELARPR
jgi:hypothetical protein